MMLDLDQIVIKAVREELDSDTRKRYDSRHPIIDYNFMMIRYGEIKYNKTKKPSIPTAKVVYHAIYSNQTPNPQTYALNITRTTTSIKEFTYQQSFTYDGKINMPTEIKKNDVEAFIQLGYYNTTTNSKANKVINTHQMIWSVDSNLVVPPNSYVTADLVVKEDEFNGEFSMVATFDGDILCYCPKKEKSRKVRAQDYYTKKIKQKEILSKEYYEMVRLRVENIFTKELGFGFDRFRRPTYDSRGIVYCKFGVEQEVCLTQFNSMPPPFETSDFH